ncbi:MAG: hypothetical protein LBK68_02770 [Candidatus Margulisbacteria bacterium]|jgi:hypothetical protein|nr:hypothetical protein [Candidatus Margulisiibacteriota bacterium]
MKKALKILIGVSVVLTLCGCGKTNLLQWAAPVPKQDNTEAARQAIDEGKYEKAYNLVKDDDSDDGKIIRAQALLGKSDIDLAAVIVALGKDAVDLGGGTKSDSPILKLESLIDDAGHRENVLAAANLYLSVNVNKTSDKVIGALTGLLAHVANLRSAVMADGKSDFKAYISGKSDNDECESFYSALGSEKLGYITMAVSFLNNGSEDIKEAVASANATLKTIDASIDFVKKAKNAKSDPNTSNDVYADIAKDLLDNITESIFEEFGYAGDTYSGKLSLKTLKSQIADAVIDDDTNPATIVAKQAIANAIKGATNLPAQAAPWETVKVLFGL